jgi:ABC-type nickel/cobalt efflux system permease component RcnA
VSDGWIPFIVEMQRELHRRLADALAAVRTQGAGAAWPLVALAFAYGVFHAAGPGHGKVVIATYLGTHESRLARGLALTVAAALAQAATAIVAVHALTAVLDQGLRASRDGVARLEPVSFALVALLGLYLALRAARRLARGHDAGPAHACATCTATQAGAGGPWSALGVVAAIGARPCAGAVVVLLLAYAGGLPLVGIAATLAMAVGTAVTTGALAVLTVGARRTAARVADRLPGSHGRLARLADGVALAGGLGLVAVGGLLLHAALTVPAHPFR